MKSNIVLIGMPGVGKSTVGVILAKILGYKFIDTDIVIQQKEGRLLREIISECGVDGFLETENRICKSLEAENSVIATGGSVVYGDEAMNHLSQISTVVYLKLDFATLKDRLGNIRNRGVVIRKGQTLEALFEERSPLYEKYADIVIDENGCDIEKTINKLIDELNITGVQGAQ